MAGQPAGLALKMSRYLIGKKIRGRRLPAVVLRRPFLAPAIVRLAVAARLASRNLATFTEAFLVALPAHRGEDHDRDRLRAQPGH